MDGFQLELGTAATDWVPSLHSFTQTSVSATSPSLHNLAFGPDVVSPGFDNPLDVTVTIGTVTGNGAGNVDFGSTLYDAAVFLADIPEKVSLIAAGTEFAGSGGWTTPSISASYGYGANGLQRGTVGSTKYAEVFDSWNTSVAQVFAVVKPTDSRVYGIRAIGAAGAVGATTTAPIVYVSNTTTSAMLVNMGTLRLSRAAIQMFALEIVSITGSGAGGIIFDTVVLQAIDSRTSATRITRSVEMPGLGGGLYKPIIGIETTLTTGAIPTLYATNAEAYVDVATAILTAVDVFPGLPVVPAGRISNVAMGDVTALMVMVPNDGSANYRKISEDNVAAKVNFTIRRAIASLLPL